MRGWNGKIKDNLPETFFNKGSLETKREVLIVNYLLGGPLLPDPIPKEYLVNQIPKEYFVNPIPKECFVSGGMLFNFVIRK
jgi:hypothetical protein